MQTTKKSLHGAIEVSEKQRKPTAICHVSNQKGLRHLRNKGFNPYKWVCDSCPAYSECKERGYLSQPDRATQSQLVALPFPTAFLDPRLRSWADLYKPKGKNTLILHDDLPLTSLFIEYQLTTKRLRQIYESWKGTLAAEWAEACLLAIQLRDWEMLKNVSLGMNADETDSVRYALTPVY